MNNKTLWENAYRTGERFKPRYPLSVCPCCGNHPAIIKLFDEHKSGKGWGKIEWYAVDYCGRVPCEGFKYPGESISMWNYECNAIKRNMRIEERETANRKNESLWTIISNWWNKKREAQGS